MTYYVYVNLSYYVNVNLTYYVDAKVKQEPV
jgi:hypothetical protein